MGKQRALKRLEQSNDYLRNLLRRLGNYSHHQLNRQPADREWSALQAMMHLQRAEALSQAYVRKKLSFGADGLAKASLASTFRGWLSRFYMRAPFRFKAPAAVSTENFPATADLAEFSDRWLQQRRQLYGYLQELPDELFYRQIYKHPLAGKLTLLDMVRFFDAHLRRHKKQAMRAISDE